MLNNPQKPLIAIVGGAKISDKIKLIDNLIDTADGIIICGGMAYTFLKVPTPVSPHGPPMSPMTHPSAASCAAAWPIPIKIPSSRSA